MELQRDSREFIGLLNSANVRYVIVGGYAVAFHGHPRFTGDMDVFVDPSLPNARLLEGVLRRFGFGDVGLSAEDFTRADTIVQLGLPPNRIDLLTALTGVTFPEAWDQRVEGELGGLRVSFISKDLLIRNKRATGRTQDLADAEAIEGQAG